MKTKEDFIKRLRNDPLYKSALKRAGNAEERKRIIAMTEAFVGRFADVLAPMIQRAQSDPKYASELREALRGSQQVVTDVVEHKSGSID